MDAQTKIFLIDNSIGPCIVGLLLTILIIKGLYALTLIILIIFLICMFLIILSLRNLVHTFAETLKSLTQMNEKEIIQDNKNKEL